MNPVSQKIAAQSQSTFLWSFYLLPSEKRHAITTIYAFSRLVDDAVDEAPSLEIAKREIGLWRKRLDIVYAVDSSSMEEGVSHPILPELKKVVKDWKIPRSYLDDLVSGMEMDLSTTRYATFQELERYCYHVASTIGLLCQHLFGPYTETAQEYAVVLGKAFQLTNIIRDVGVDAEKGRIYLPQDEMKEFGVSESQILMGQSDENFLKLIVFQANRAEAFFQKAFSLLSPQERHGVLPTSIMTAFYYEILQKLKKHGFPVLSGKMSLSTLKKVGLMSACLGRYWRHRV